MQKMHLVTTTSRFLNQKVYLLKPQEAPGNLLKDLSEEWHVPVGDLEAMATSVSEVKARDVFDSLCLLRDEVSDAMC